MKHLNLSLILCLAMAAPVTADAAKQLLCMPNDGNIILAKKKCRPNETVVTPDTIYSMAAEAASGAVRVLACSQGDAAGRWDGYLTGVGSRAAQECILAVDAQGTVTGLSCQTVGTNTAYPIASGSLQVYEDCRVQGSIQFDNGVTAQIIARMSADHGTVIGAFTNSAGDRGSFSGIRLNK
jgi:hypothetical protein